MPINIRRYITSDVDSTSITSLFRFASSNAREQEQKGEVICLITLVQSKDFLADKAIKFVWDSIRDTYLTANSGSIVEDVKKSISAGRKKIVELVKNDKEIEARGVDLSFCLVIIKGMNAYLGIFGEEELYLFKNKSFVNVGQILNENKASAASMALADKDVVFMGTKSTVGKYVKDNDGERMAKTFSNYGDQLPSNEAIVALSRDDIFENLVEDVIEVPKQDDISKSDVRSFNKFSEIPEAGVSEDIVSQDGDNINVVNNQTTEDTDEIHDLRDVDQEQEQKVAALNAREQQEKDARQKILDEYAKERKLG